MFESLDEQGRGEQRIVGSGVEPGNTTPERVDTQFAHLQITEVPLGNFQFPPCRRGEAAGDLDHARIVEVQTSNRPGRTRVRWLLLQVNRAASLVKFNNPVTFRVADL